MIESSSLISRWEKLCVELHRMHGARSPAAPVPTLVAVSKTQPVQALEALLHAGQRDFAENKVQEAAAKWPQLRARFPDLRLRMIGSLQSNKVHAALELFDVIETLDRPSLVDAVAKARAKTGAGRCGRFLIQVNCGREPQKGGVAPEGVESLLVYCRAYGLPVTGLMCVPPAGAEPTPHFAALKAEAMRLGLPECSMGMSADFEAAIREGATSVRLGTLLFGARS